MELVDALIVPNSSAVGGHNGNGLGAVVGGTAAQRDHAVAAVLLIKGETGLYIGIPGVRLCPAEHGGFDAGLFENFLNPGGHGMGGEKAVGNNHGALAAQTVHQCAHLGNGTGTKDITGGEIVIGRHHKTFFLS